MDGNTSVPAAEAAIEAVIRPYWNTLEELHILAMSRGCTKAQFVEAIETMGSNPSDVANYLQRYALTWSVPLPKRKLTLHRRGA
jgi:hypothetical protein